MKTTQPTAVFPETPGDEIPLTVRVEQRGGVTVVRLTGEIDVTGIPPLERALEGGVPADGLGLVVDLTNVSYFSSATIKVLFTASERLHQRGKQIRVAIGDAAPMRKVLSLLNLDRLIPLDPTVEDSRARITADAQRSPQ